MKVLLAGGGTAGHINPALAIADTIKQKSPKSEILFVGNLTGMESKLIPAAGYNFSGVDVRGFRRKLTPENIIYDIGAIKRMFTSGFQAKKIIQEFKPDIAIGTGGYVSGPVLRQAAKMNIPITIHESNAFPGITTKMLSKYAKSVMIAVEDARNHLDKDCKIEVTGNPVREEILMMKKEDARKELKLNENKLLILSFGGSLGADRINKAVIELIKSNAKNDKIYHIHGTGKSGYSWTSRLIQEKGVNLSTNKNIRILEYINNMPVVLNAADIVICRAGAMTLAEISVAGKVSILIPSPNVTENHQYHNAMALVKKDAAVLIEDKNLTGESLINEAKKLLSDEEKLKRMGQNAQKTAIIDATQRIYEIIVRIIKTGE